MHDHNLDDLIIDNIEPKNRKTKSFLTIIALLIVILIVAIILTKILLNTPNENRLALEEDTTEMIAPELQLKETPEPEVQKEKAKTEIELPEVPQASKSEKEPLLSNIQDQEIKAPETEVKKPVTAEESELTLKEKAAKDAADIAYWKAVQEKRKAEQIAYESKTRQEPAAVTKEERTEKAVKPTKVQTPKPVATVVKKPVKKPVAAKPASKTVSTGRYYVQVGAYRNTPSKRFLSVIRNNGYRYFMTKPDANGLKRLLIGPYRDRASVNHALSRVRDRIHKHAFVVKR